MNGWTQYDIADYLDTEESQCAYLSAALELGDPKIIQAALGDVAQAKGMSSISETTGLSRENLYRSLSGEKEAYFSTVLKVFDALGFSIRIAPKPPQQSLASTSAS